MYAWWKKIPDPKPVKYTDLWLLNLNTIWTTIFPWNRYHSLNRAVVTKDIYPNWIWYSLVYSKKEKDWTIGTGQFIVFVPESDRQKQTYIESNPKFLLDLFKKKFSEQIKEDTNSELSIASTTFISMKWNE